MAHTPKIDFLVIFVVLPLLAVFVVFGVFRPNWVFGPKTDPGQGGPPSPPSPPSLRPVPIFAPKNAWSVSTDPPGGVGYPLPLPPPVNP